MDDVFFFWNRPNEPLIVYSTLGWNMSQETNEVMADELENTAEQTAVETTPEDASPEGGEGEAEKVERKGDLPQGVKKRFSVLTQRNRALEEEIAQIKAQLTQKKPQLSREDLTDDEWIEYQVEQKLAKQEQARIQAEKASQAEKAKAERMNAKIQEFAAIVPDLKATLEEAVDLPLPKSAVEYLRDSDLAPVLAYRIAKDDDLYEKIQEAGRDRSGRAMDRLLTKLELKIESELESKKAAPGAKAPQSKPVGEPAPRGSSSKSEAFNPAKLPMAEYRKWRAANPKG